MAEGIKDSKWDSLEKEMKKYEIYDEDLIEKFILGSGSGGQKVNKTHSCVYIKHVPSGIEVKCQKTRSREANRFHARREILEKVKDVVFKEETKRKKEADKIRKQKNAGHANLKRRCSKKKGSDHKQRINEKSPVRMTSLYRSSILS